MADNLNDSEQTTEQTHEYLEGHDANGVTETQEETKHNHDEPGQTNTGKEESDTNGANCEICENADSDRPVVELFVKAAVDKMKNGSCPICHRYFMMFYVLREKGLIDLVVTTFLPENPPKEVLAFSNGKRYPLVKVHRGVDSDGVDMTGVECDLPDEIEKLIDKFECEEMKPRRRGDKADEAERAFENLYPKFKIFMKGGERADPEPLRRILGRVNMFLKSNTTKFLVSDVISRADCYLLPIVQHVRVAGKAYHGFEIPTELTHLWRYLENAYDTDAFRESCPADREIISHYINFVHAPGIQKKATLMAENRTFSVPEAGTSE